MYGPEEITVSWTISLLFNISVSVSFICVIKVRVSPCELELLISDGIEDSFICNHLFQKIGSPRWYKKPLEPVSPSQVLPYFFCYQVCWGAEGISQCWQARWGIQGPAGAHTQCCSRKQVNMELTLDAVHENRLIWSSHSMLFTKTG